MIDITTLMLTLISINLPCFTSQKPYCNQTCPGSILNNNIPYPFGFSSGCEIRLNCTTNSTVVIGEFSVQKLTQDDLLVSLPAKCGREVQTLGHLYGDNYAPTSDNAFLMENCTEQVLTCSVPESTIQPNLQVIYCGDQGDVYSNVSCYSGDRNSMFLGYDNVTKTGCRFLLSGVVVKIVGDNPAVSLNVQVVKLGWWLKGRCQCSHDAICTEFVSPVDGGGAYRCRCKDGYDGDGYIASSGCRKAKPVVSSHCNTLKFMFGHCKGSERAGVLVGIIAIGATLISSIGLMYCYTRHHTNAKSRGKSNRRLCEAKGITIPIYSYKEIQNATNGFSDKQKLGTGGYGTVYKGKIGKGEWVAIKCIKHQYGDDIDQVMNEIILLSSVNHPNLVRLLGCSFDRNDHILIYEFMPNGTLSEHLQRERGNGLPWPVRLTIAIEIIQGIAYLHSTMNPPIYHRDVKSCNILLDYNFKTKVADFGLSRLGITDSSHISTAPRGTPGYLDPQYHQNFHLTDKSDVYSFGVVLVEIITALKAVDFSRKHSEVNLALLAVDRIGKGNLDEIIDPFLNPIEDVSIRKVAEVAFRCLAYDSDMRPPMTEVASELEHIKVSNFTS
ncbi:wall-associated receptor kinase-like 14 [Bidens hawaiensis]|uniref:wall-associated receptor kinase-like 14 n=1 Tax=Bidens hawaiensis TaxID=980011 RepID=UPI0040498689